MANEQSCALADALDLLTDTYNYNHWVYSLLRPHLGARVMEVGAGIGNVTRFLLACDRVVAIEVDAKYLPSLTELAGVHRNLTVLHSGVLDLPAGDAPADSFDTVLCVNVLEHIKDDRAAMRAMACLLKPGGKLLLYVPACRWAFGTLDQALGHHRRYSRRDMKDLAAGAGLSMRECRFVNFIGAFGWFWAARVCKEGTISHSKAQFVDRLVPYLSALERLVRPPVGQSLFAVMARGGAPGASAPRETHEGGSCVP